MRRSNSSLVGNKLRPLKLAQKESPQCGLLYAWHVDCDARLLSAGFFGWSALMPSVLLVILSALIIFGPGAWQLTANVREASRARRSKATEHVVSATTFQISNHPQVVISDGD